MKNIFESVTLKLTGWYLLIVMIVSVAFSAVIYQLAMSELSARLDVVQSEVETNPNLNLPSNFFNEVRSDQYEMASQNFLNGLFNVNLFILLAGGVGSFLLAKRTLRPIEDANEAQSRFVADASHQLRTPLAVMRAELETAKRDPKLSQQDIKELIDSNLEEVDKLSTLSLRLLELSKFDSQPQHAILSKQSLSQLVKQSVAKRRSMGKRFNIKAANKLFILADKDQINELLDILVDNALKYSPRDSLIKIRTSKSGFQAILTISNQGQEITKTELSRIFDRFYRSANSAGKSGHGLGLSIAQKIVESHNGKIEAASAPDGCTIFTVRLPLLGRSVK